MGKDTQVMSMYLKLVLSALFGLLLGAFASEQLVNVVLFVGVVVALLCVVYLVWPRGTSIEGGIAVLPLFYVIVICGCVFLAHAGTASIDWPWPNFQYRGFDVLR